VETLAAAHIGSSTFRGFSRRYLRGHLVFSDGITILGRMEFQFYCMHSSGLELCLSLSLSFEATA